MMSTVEDPNDYCDTATALGRAQASAMQFNALHRNAAFHSINYRTICIYDKISKVRLGSFLKCNQLLYFSAGS